MPVFDDMLWGFMGSIQQDVKKDGCSAVFVDSGGQAMTDATYYKIFNRLKEVDDFEKKNYE